LGFGYKDGCFVGWAVGLDQNRGKNWLGSEKNWLIMGFVMMGKMIFMLMGLNWLGSENFFFFFFFLLHLISSDLIFNC
jgi:hypothetical protein